jgi:hypothetical protein
MKKVQIPSYLKEYATKLTNRRIELNRERYEGTHKQRTGVTKSALFGGEVDREFYTEYIGILAELLTRHYYEWNPTYTSYEVSTFLKDPSIVRDDIDLSVVKNGNRQTISIKACEKSLKANKRAMDREDADVVVFILFTSEDDYIVEHFTPAQVQEWKVRYGFSPYYDLSLSKLKELNDTDATGHQPSNEGNSRPTDSKE